MKLHSILWILTSILSVAQAGGLDPSAPRGTSIQKFAVPGSAKSEICVVPKHLPFADYKNKDVKSEASLCKLNFYEPSGNTDSTGAVAVCPKVSSTSAATMLYSFGDGHTKSELESTANCVALQGTTKPDSLTGVKQAGKFKQTDDDRTCTYTPAVLAAYHLSRALGGAGAIAPAVIRTMDFAKHDRVVSQALSIPKVGANSALKTSWSDFRKYSAGSSGNPSSLFTADGTQIYGFIVDHQGGTDLYREWITDKSTDQTSLPELSAYRNMSSSSPASSLVGSRDFTQSTVQTLIAMRDMSEMILLDTLLQQNDRLSGRNIDAYSETVYRAGGEIKHEKDPKKVPAGAGGFAVKRVALEDNDCGLIEGPGQMVKSGAIDHINHMHPSTYVRLMQLADKWEKDPSVKAFFQSEALFSDKILATFGAGLLKARDSLRSRCRAGTLKLDLDLDDFFAGRDVDKSRCDAVEPPAAGGA